VLLVSQKLDRHAVLLLLKIEILGLAYSGLILIQNVTYINSVLEKYFILIHQGEILPNKNVITSKLVGPSEPILFMTVLSVPFLLRLLM
jgi:hypothetical protein